MQREVQILYDFFKSQLELRKLKSKYSFQKWLKDFNN